MSKAFQIGCCQVLALIPGMSRSGATILGGELLGVDRVAATKFTFYLAVPTMLGATVFELTRKARSLSHGQSLDIAVGFVVSFVVAYVVIRQFLVIVAQLRPDAVRLVSHRRGPGAGRLSAGSEPRGFSRAQIGIFAFGAETPEIGRHFRFHRGGRDTEIGQGRARSATPHCHDFSSLT